MIKTANVSLPDFGAEPACPAPIPAGMYATRLDRTIARMTRAGFDFLVVYGDREHFANLAYLTGFDPRFEEALFLLDGRGRKRLLVGNECMGYLPSPDLGIEVELFQDFSLMGQPRDRSRSLRSLVADFGIGPGRKVGCVGWKCLDADLVEGGDLALELPSFVVDVLRELTGARQNVRNATALFIHPQDGLRVSNEAEQIAHFEYAATVTSGGVLALLSRIQVGVEERELERFLDSQGLPLSCHRMVGFGDKARRGLASPGDRMASLGDPYTVGFGVNGALTCRAGCVAYGPRDLSVELRDFYPRLARNYFKVLAAWYEAVRVGATGDAVFRAAAGARDRQLFDFAVNPGHLLHLDEWVHSPFAAGQSVKLRSGMVLQADIIPVSRGPFCAINAEDGVALADEALQGELAARFPACLARMLKRREFMKAALGIRLHRSVLPLGNLPAWLPPYVLAPGTVLVKG